MALKLRSPIGEELLIRFTYEHLRNFYYLCGWLGHIDKYYEAQFENGFREMKEATPYEPWLRASTSERRWVQAVSMGHRPPTHSLQYRPPLCTGAAVFGTFNVSKDSSAPRMDHREHMLMSHPSCKIPGEGSAAEDVDSSPPAFNWGKTVDIDMIGYCSGFGRLSRG
ncbi:UNVERIFIED_CONTAM: hypothetical protein Sradi_0726600 [Sesamum radiatum]|uniref:Zinc knuckle CX2CX4HX4C domain-containing protein n=1 Tax=Sesamum radiatum TaxID=300843 RepID=A0AAW2VT28_SESRA